MQLRAFARAVDAVLVHRERAEGAARICRRFVGRLGATDADLRRPGEEVHETVEAVVEAPLAEKWVEARGGVLRVRLCRSIRWCRALVPHAAQSTVRSQPNG